MKTTDEVAKKLHRVPDVTPKTLYGVVQYLRDRNELDEKKWEKIQKLIFTQFIVLCSIFAFGWGYCAYRLFSISIPTAPLLLLWSLLACSLVFAFLIIRYLYTKDIEPIIIYSLGVKSQGVVTATRKDYVIGLAFQQPFIDYEYKDHLNNHYKSYHHLASSHVLSRSSPRTPRIGPPNEGDEIDIIYLKDDPRRSKLYLPSHEIHNLRKEN